jgi:transcriptional regulator with XRE-family HTH domain
MVLGERVKGRMEELGLSQAELARRVGVAQPTISQLIHRSKKGSTHLHRIARELGTTPAYLMGDTDDPDEDAPPEPEFTSDERALISDYRQLSAEDRSAVRRIVQTMIGPKTLHAPNLKYRNE